jgi:hypothetical protein
MAGNATVATAPTTRVHFDVRGRALDVNRVASAMPKTPTRHRAATPPENRRTERPTPPTTEVDGTVHFDKVTAGPAPLTDVNVHGVLSRGTLTFEDTRANVYGGKVDLSGSAVDLKGSRPAWDVVMHASQLNAGAMAKGTGGGPPPVEGHVAATANVAGRGTELPDVRPSMAGSAQVTVKDLSLTPKQADTVLSQIAKTLSQAGLSGPEASVLDPRWIQNGNAEAKFSVGGGAVKLDGPLQVHMPAGDLTLNGQMALSGEISLAGPVTLKAPFVHHMTGGKVAPSGPLTVPLNIGGTIDDPKVGVAISPFDVAKDVLKVQPVQIPGIPIPSIPH